MSELLIAGVDEAGRGPLAGPVVAAAVILDSARPIEGLADSKRLSATKREILALKIKQQAHAWALGSANVEEIDRLNILQASMLAMCRAVTALKIAPGLIKVDGNRCPAFDCPAQAIIGGDATVAEISAASILAKTARDAAMQNLHMHYPLYAFDRHKGYPTALHRRLLQQYGACPQHRRSYAPVQAVMAQLLHV